MKLKKLIAILASLSMLATSVTALAVPSDDPVQAPAAVTEAEEVVTHSGGAVDEASEEEMKLFIASEKEEELSIATEEDPVAKIGDVGYTTLQEAIDAAESGATIELLEDVETSSTITIKKAVTINGNDKSVSTTNLKYVIEINTETTDDRVVISNLNVNVSKRGIFVNPKENVGANVAIYNCDITLNGITDDNDYNQYADDTYTMGVAINAKAGTIDIENTNIKGFAYCINAFGNTSNFSVNVTGGKISGRAVFNVWSNNAEFTLDGVEVRGLNKQTGPTEAFACIVDNDRDTYNGVVVHDNKYTIKNTAFTAWLSEAALNTSGSNASEHMITLRGTNSKVLIYGNTTYTAYVGDAEQTLSADNEDRFGLVYNYKSRLDYNGTNQVHVDADALESLADEISAMDIDKSDSTVIEGGKRLTYIAEVYYYWETGSGIQGEGCDFNVPFDNGWLLDGEFIDVQKDIALTKDLSTSSSFTLNLKGKNLDRNGHTILLASSYYGIQTVTSDSPELESLFTVPEGYKLACKADGDKYVYSVIKVVDKEQAFDLGNNTVMAIASVYSLDENNEPVEQDVYVTIEDVVSEGDDATFKDKNGTPITDPSSIYMLVQSDVTQESDNPEYTSAVNGADRVYDIKFVDENGDPVTFNGEATVDIPYNTDKAIRVYYVAPDGSKENMNAEYDNGCITFTTTHFSTYIVESEADITDNVSIMFKKVDSTAEEDANKYDIYAVADDGKLINRLSSTQLEFALTVDGSGAVSYDITPATNISLIGPDADGYYEFNYDGNNDVNDSGNMSSEVKLGTVQFSGYGKFTFKTTNDDDKAQLHTATFEDNIVRDYLPDGALYKLILTAANSTNNADNTAFEFGDIVDSEITSAKQKLDINVIFPNDAQAQAAAYNDMKVTISGGDLPQAYEIALGNDVADVSDSDSFVAADGTKGSYSVTYVTNNTFSAPNEYNEYKLSIENLLSKNVAYTVAVSGEGYRTARYTVNMTDDKELNFWNNVMDTAKAIEEGKATMQTNFLAGDIVKDNKINIYDLSAVVSYFGTVDITAMTEAEKDTYVKYDLNRDGKIDSKDIAYVLVSWDN